jgi:hypothetical protein
MGLELSGIGEFELNFNSKTPQFLTGNSVSDPRMSYGQLATATATATLDDFRSLY